MGSVMLSSVILCFMIFVADGAASHTCQRFNLKAGMNPDPLDCAGYIYCSQGRIEIDKCPQGTVFNPKIYNCDGPSTVPSCTASTTTTATATSTTTAATTTTSTATTRTQPTSKSTEPKRNRPTTTTPKPHSTRLTLKDERHLCRILNLSSGTYPDPVNCSNFIQCANGITFVFKCTYPQRYNAKFKICDYSSNVDCKKNLSFRGNVRRTKS